MTVAKLEATMTAWEYDGWVAYHGLLAKEQEERMNKAKTKGKTPMKQTRQTPTKKKTG